jgi:hypothetical protein
MAGSGGSSVFTWTGRQLSRLAARRRTAMGQKMVFKVDSPVAIYFGSFLKLPKY